MPRGHKIDLRNCTFSIKDRSSTGQDVYPILTRATGFPPLLYGRSCYGVCVHGDYLFNAGGYITSARYKDVYRTTDLMNWSLVSTITGPSSAYYICQMFSFKGDLYAGLTNKSIAENAAIRADPPLWYKSSDNGESWSSVTIDIAQYAYCPDRYVIRNTFFYRDYIGTQINKYDTLGKLQIAYYDISSIYKSKNFFYTHAMDFYLMNGCTSGDTYNNVYRSLNLVDWELISALPYDTPAGYVSKIQGIFHTSNYVYILYAHIKNGVPYIYNMFRTNDFITFENVTIDVDQGYQDSRYYSHYVVHNGMVLFYGTDPNNSPYSLFALYEEQYIPVCNQLDIKVGSGELFFREKKQYEYLKEKRRLDEVKEGEDIPMEIDFQFKWDFLTSNSGETPTIEDVLKNHAGWTSTSDCDYTLDLEILHEPCPGQVERIILPDFSYETLVHTIKDGYVKCSGTCNATEATVTREDT